MAISGTTHTKGEIAAHNSSITLEINAKTTEKEKYDRVGGKASAIAGSFLELSGSAQEISSILEELVVTGKTFDDGSFKMLGSDFESIAGTFSNISSTCQTKSKELQAEINKLKTSYWSTMLVQ